MAERPVANLRPALLPLSLVDVGWSVGGKQVLAGITATLQHGSRTVVLGANGAGKSVLLRLCHGLLQPTSGQLRWSTPEVPGAPRRQAMVFQRPVLFRRSVLGNMTFALGIAGIARSERRDRALAALERVGLAALADRPARVLSGGEQQRLTLARAWSLGPEVLFLDEPTANLDPGATREIEAVIGAIHAGGTKIVLVTHNLGQARRLGDEVLFLDRGRLVERSPIDRFFHQPTSAEAAAFLNGELPWH
ncbi:MAG: ATP-binding cassette domain-containing protein [Betaproteobacteria bacterium]|nr:ATP-binding cassette domain-containing protein [Betaproteobacteria bacterium]